MRIPIVVLCLAVIYATCSIYAEENVNSIKEIANDGDYISGSVDEFLRERTRHKRDIIPSPLDIALKMLGLSDNIVIKNILNTMKFISAMWNRREQICPKTEKFSLSLDLIEKMILHPITSMKDIICYISNIIGSQAQQVASMLFDFTWKFLTKICLPILHDVLNRLKDSGVLPPSLNRLIELFNIFYTTLKIIRVV